MDGEILIALKERHTPTPAHVAKLRRELPKRFPELTFFFQPADIVNQVLNFGQPAPIDIRVTGRNGDAAYAAASKLAADLRGVPGVGSAREELSIRPLACFRAGAAQSQRIDTVHLRES